MGKKLLAVLIVLVSFLQSTFAQCPDCHNGMHLRKPGEKVIVSDKPMDGSGTLGQSYVQQNVCGLAYVSATAYTTTRYSTPGTGFPTTLTVSGIPATCVTILKAYLFYGVSYTEGTAPATSAKITNPVPTTNTYPAVLTGTAGSVCWGESGTAGYRADVTPIITGN